MNCAPFDSPGRLRAAAQALWDFAENNRELYAVVAGLDGLDAYGCHDQATPPALRRVASELFLSPESALQADRLADRITATAHGFIALVRAGRFPGGAPRGSALFLETVDDFLKNFQPC